MATAGPGPFQLLWTIGFSGKRFLAPSAEGAVAVALRQVLGAMIAEAVSQSARLTAISSIARGGDVLFAETVQDPGLAGGPLPWKCLLPFAWEPFIRNDLDRDADKQPLSESERSERRRRAEACLERALHPPEITSGCSDAANDEEREEAFLECGYRTVDAADVMILLLRETEYEQVKTLAGDSCGHPSPAQRRGTFAVACYALAAECPVVLLNADAPDISASVFRIAPAARGGRSGNWFVDPLVTEIVQKAVQLLWTDPAVLREKIGGLSGPMTPARSSVAMIGAQLGALANQQQGQTQRRLRDVLHCHLVASTLAAVGATVLHLSDPSGRPVLLLVAWAMAGLLKPGFAFGAWWIERQLHRQGNRDAWLHARVLAELCRGALSTWSLPQQPLDAQDEEDFPRTKRLIRTLRLLREQDARAAIQGTPRGASETQLDADMRAACALYSVGRLDDQAAYYDRQLEKAQRQARRWRTGFQVATWSAVGIGLLLVGDRLVMVSGLDLLGDRLERLLEALLIIAPFVATYCLGTMAILDVRRRCRRYAEMGVYLRQLAATLNRTWANPSRLRLIEHAERTLIEEQHEWFSVVRNLSV
jgi:hypothetical protein